MHIRRLDQNCAASNIFLNLHSGARDLSTFGPKGRPVFPVISVNRINNNFSSLLQNKLLFRRLTLLTAPHTCNSSIYRDQYFHFKGFRICTVLAS